jgi:beta-lactamase regulating signal transducer with metallopeptidase domain
MTAVSLQTLHALGWTLLHFVWQGAVLAALFSAALMVSRNANVRYALGLGTLVLMMAAPVITFAWLNRAPEPTVAAEMSVTAPAVEVVSTTEAASSTEPLVQALAARTNREDMMLWLVQAWFVGVMLLSVRTAGGLFWVARARRAEIEPLSEEVYRQCVALQRRMGLQRHIRYGQGRGLDSPVVIGWFRPIVLVTTQAITGLSPQQLQAIIAHELAHVRRYDAFVNLFQIAVEMFLFYHPAVWWVSRRIRIEREVCCDHEALAACGEPVSYARALTMMEEWRASPSMMMAANRSPLAERVLRLLGMQGTSARSRAAGLSACVLGIAVALFAGSVFVAAAQATAADQQPEAVTPAPAPAPQPKPASAPQAAALPSPAMAPRPPVEARSPREATASNNSSNVKDIEAAGLRSVGSDELIAMRVHGITPAYIKEMLATKLSPDAGQLIAMKVHDVTPEYIDELRRLVSNVNTDNVIAMKVHGMTPAYIEDMLATKLNPDADQLIAMKVHDVTPDYIDELRRIVSNVSTDNVIAMKVHDVTPEYIREMQAAGMDTRVADDFIAAKVLGMTPELVRSAIGWSSMISRSKG